MGSNFIFPDNITAVGEILSGKRGWTLDIVGKKIKI